MLSAMTRQFSLLVVDDDLAIRESITRVLEAEGYLVSSAASCSDAIYELDRRQIDMVLLDLNLGKAVGWEAFDVLKERRPSLPIIVTSGRADELKHSSVTRASGVLEKPFDMPVLLTILKEANRPHVNPEVPSGNMLLSAETGRFSDNPSASIPKPEQLVSVQTAQVVETKHRTPSSYDGISSALAHINNSGRK